MIRFGRWCRSQLPALLTTLVMSVVAAVLFVHCPVLAAIVSRDAAVLTVVVTPVVTADLGAPVRCPTDHWFLELSPGVLSQIIWDEALEYLEQFFVSLLG